MRWKINFDECLLLLIYVEATILGFFGLTQLFNKVIFVLIFIRLIKHYKECANDMIFYFFFLLLMAMSVIQGDGSLIIGIRNFLVLLYPMAQAYFILYLCKHKPSFVDTFMKKYFYFFNFTAIMNLFGALVQCFKPNVICPVNTYGYEVMDFDNITGFFSYGATHTLCVFMVFIILYNLSFIKAPILRLKNLLFTIYIACIILAMCVISLIGDNKAFFMLLPVVLCVYFIFVYTYKISKERIIKIVLAFLVLALLLFLAYYTNAMVRNIFNKIIVKTLGMMRDSIHLGNQANGSGERIAILKYALCTLSTWFLGKGFGAAMVFEEGYQGFAHFGQADLGSILLLGGLWFSLFFLFMYSRLFLSFVSFHKPGKRGPWYNVRMTRSSIVYGMLKWVTMIGFLLILSLYTQCFTRTDIMLCLSIMILSLRQAIREHLNYMIKE